MAANDAAESLPLFYKKPRPLDRKLDGDKKLPRNVNYGFTATTNALPLVVEEFPIAAAHYPVVFIAGPTPIPAAIVGITADKNLFIDQSGHWMPGVYIPAYVRRYPFILVDDPVNKQFLLCIDEESGMLSDHGEIPLFSGEQPSEATQNALQFCTALRQQGEATDEFINALVKQNLLVEQTLQLSMPNGEKNMVGGFMIVDEAKFNDMPDAVWTEWRRKGWVALVYAHLLSSHRWQRLVDLDAAAR